MTATILKRIVYRGGLLTFSIPGHWKEEYEPDGGGTFFEDRDGAGVLRLNVLTAESPNVLSRRDAAVALRTIVEDSDVAPELLPNGDALVTLTEAAQEDGEDLLLSFWQLAHVVPPRHAHIAIFSYTYSASQEDDPGIRAELALLDAQIRAASIADDLGE